MLYRWQLEWPSIQKGCEGRNEKRRGVDVLHFEDGRIIRKLTYSKTTLEIDGKRVRLIPAPPKWQPELFVSDRLSAQTV